jgi:DNA polymerase-3 subunit alpha
MVFQEDVLKVCHHFAGLDLADADVLRRAMSGKFRSKAEFQRIIDKFFAGCKANGHSEEISKEVWRQVESFAGYSFSKAHSASFAVESFQSLFLKTYYPKEFMVAVINNFGGFYKTWVYVQELIKTGVQLHLPNINESEVLTVIKGNEVYLGFGLIESLEHKTIEAILEERNFKGAFTSLSDFMDRVRVSVIQTKILIKVGAFSFTGLGKKQLMWQAHMFFNEKQGLGSTRKHTDKQHTLTYPTAAHQPVLLAETLQTLLFEKPHKEFALPNLVHNAIEDAYDEIELLGFSVSMTDFELLEEDITTLKEQKQVLLSAKQLNHYLHKTVEIIGNYVTTKGVKTSRGDYMAFGTFYDAESNFFDTTHFPPSLKVFPFAGKGVYLIKGNVVEEFGFYSLEVLEMKKLATKPDPRY